jgi:hypothetical protein
MNKFLSNFLFSLIITLSMNGLDMVYHLATGWTVHLNYVAIKLTAIFLTTFLITQFIGKGKEQGIISSILGPVMFYIYYVSAVPTLNREVFWLDEQFFFIFLHSFFMLISYFAALNFLDSKKEFIRKLSFLLLTSVNSIAIYALALMSQWRLQGLDEETAASLMTFTLISPSILSFVPATIITLFWPQNKLYRSITTSLIASFLIFFLTNELLYSLFAFFIVNIVFFVILNYNTRSYVSNIISKKAWLILAILTLIIGSFYQFIPRKTIKSIAEFLIFDFVVFGYRIRQNDIILVSTILLIISLVSFYKFYKLRK